MANKNHTQKKTRAL